MKLEYYGKIIEKYSNIIFHENPTSGGRVAPCRWTDMKKLIIRVCNFVGVPSVQTILNLRICLLVCETM